MAGPRGFEPLAFGFVEATSTSAESGNAMQPDETVTGGSEADCSEKRPGAADPKPRATPELQGSGRILTVREVAEILRVCTAIVYRLCKTGELPHFRVSNSIRVWESDVRAFARS